VRNRLLSGAHHIRLGAVEASDPVSVRGSVDGYAPGAPMLVASTVTIIKSQATPILTAGKVTVQAVKSPTPTAAAPAVQTS
jgi:hypothetical protein